MPVSYDVIHVGGRLYTEYEGPYSVNVQVPGLPVAGQFTQLLELDVIPDVQIEVGCGHDSVFGFMADLLAQQEEWQAAEADCCFAG